MFDALVAFTEGREYFPSQREFRAAGAWRLCVAVQNSGGVAIWAERLGLPLRATQAHRPFPYTEEDARRDAQAVIAEHGYLPSVRKLRALGHRRLAGRIHWHHRNSGAFLTAQGWPPNGKPTRHHWTD